MYSFVKLKAPGPFESEARMSVRGTMPRITWLFCLVALYCALPTPLALAHSAPGSPTAAGDLLGARVLVLHSYHQGFTWTDNISRGIQLAFADHMS